MKWLLAAGLVLVLAVAVVGPASAESMPMTCDMTTIASLSDCVQHAYQMGAIENQGLYMALQSQLAAAQKAVDRGDPANAINILYAFINTVQAQAGVHIESMHAEHMIMHAQTVITNLNN
jgi:hypothetical protein